MNSASVKRWLMWHGILIFLLGLLSGALVPIFVNPRMGVAAHLGGVMSGMFLLLVGVIWDQLKLRPRAEKAALWLFLYASYTGWLAQFLSAWFGTSRATPIAGAGYSGSPWQENLVYFVAISFSVAITLACLLALWGLSNRRAAAAGPIDQLP